jgi:uncharacterized protein (DUF433 family)
VNDALGNGVYSFNEAARLTGLRTQRIREWFHGRASKSGKKPFIQGDYGSVDGDFAISFLDLIDVYVAGQLRERAVPLQTLRRVFKKMSEDLKTTHPFSHKELQTDGEDVFIRSIDDEGKEELVEVLTRQKVFVEIIEPFLKRIDYDSDALLARRWHISNEVVVDPAICFGKPILEDVSIPTVVLFDAYRANNNDAALVGRWYKVRPEQVKAAVRFEERMAA